MHVGAVIALASGLGVIIVGGAFLLLGFRKEHRSPLGKPVDPRDHPEEYCPACKGEGHVDSPDASLSWTCPQCGGSGWA